MNAYDNPDLTVRESVEGAKTIVTESKALVDPLVETLESKVADLTDTYCIGQLTQAANALRGVSINLQSEENRLAGIIAGWSGDAPTDP